MRGDYKNVSGRRRMPCRSVSANRPQPCPVHIHMLAFDTWEANDGTETTFVVIGAWPSAPAPLFATLCCALRDPRSASAPRQGRRPSCESALVRAFDWRCREVQSPNQGASPVRGLCVASSAAVLPLGVRREFARALLLVRCRCQIAILCLSCVCL
jgi:hypothetical protein